MISFKSNENIHKKESISSDLAKNQSSLRLYICPNYVQVCWRSDQKISFGSDKVKYRPFLYSRAGNSNVNISEQAENQIFNQAFVCPAYLQDLFKNKEAIYRTRWNVGLWYSRASNSKRNIPIWPKFDLLRDFMTVMVSCKFHKKPIKNKEAIDWTYPV